MFLVGVHNQYQQMYKTLVVELTILNAKTFTNNCTKNVFIEYRKQSASN